MLCQFAVLTKEGDPMLIYPHAGCHIEAAREQDMEGVVAKRSDSRYETDRRSGSWLKIRVPHTARLAVVGWEEGKGSRKRLGSLKLGWYLPGSSNGALVFAGNVGSGLDDATVLGCRGGFLVDVDVLVEEPHCEL